MVPDSDIYGKAIQCFLNYVEGSAKQSYIGNSRGKKVHVFANHNEIVSKEPKVAGSWPKKDIEAWLADAGHEPAPAPAPPTAAVAPLIDDTVAADADARDTGMYNNMFLCVN